MKRLVISIWIFWMVATAITFAQYGNSEGPDVERIKQYLGGQKLEISYRDGGPLYGTTYVKEVHLCSSGQYFEYGFSERQTVMDNFQRNSWEDSGTWEIVMFKGQVLLGSRSNSGGGFSYAPIRIMPDGSIWISDDVTVRRVGRAQCQ